MTFLKSENKALLMKSKETLVKLNKNSPSCLINCITAEDDERVLKNICPVVAELDTDSALPVLEMLFKHESVDVRVAAAHELSRIGNVTLSETAKRASIDPSCKVRLAFINGLAGGNGKTKDICLFPFTRDPVEQIRKRAEALLKTKGIYSNEV